MVGVFVGSDVIVKAGVLVWVGVKVDVWVGVLVMVGVWVMAGSVELGVSVASGGSAEPQPAETIRTKRKKNVSKKRGVRCMAGINQYRRLSLVG